MLKTIQSQANIQHSQTADHSTSTSQIKVYGAVNFLYSVIERIVAEVQSLEKGCEPSRLIDKNRIKLLSPGVSEPVENFETRAVDTPQESHVLPVLGETSGELLRVLEKNLGLQAAAPWRALLSQCCRIHGADKVLQMHHDADGTYTLELSEPLRIWMYSTDDKNRVDPIGGIVLMLGANQYQPLRREQLSGCQMKFKVTENEIRFLGGLEIFVKTPAWARPLTLYQMQEYDYTDVVSYKVNGTRGTLTAQYEISFVTAHKAREKDLDHLTKTWAGESPTHPIEVLPSCSPDQIKATAQACIQRHLNSYV